MRDGLKRTDCETTPKTKWVKPAVQQFKAGSAEVNSGTVDDTDPGTAATES